MFILQLIDAVTRKREFNIETTSIGWIYAAHIQNVLEYKTARFKNVTIEVNDFIKEDYDVRADNGYCGVAFRYDIEAFFKLNEAERIKEINELYYRNLKLLLNKLQLPIEPLTEIYGKIIANNYVIPLIISKQASSKNRTLKARVIMLPTTKSFDYCLLIQDGKSEDMLRNVRLFKCRPGTTWFIAGVISKVKWYDNDTIAILDALGNEVYKYIVSSNVIERINESNLKRYFV